MSARCILHWHNYLFLLVCLLLSPALVLGQNAQKQTKPQSDDVVRVFTELVQTDVMVFDKQGNFLEEAEVRLDPLHESLSKVQFLTLVTCG